MTGMGLRLCVAAGSIAPCHQVITGRLGFCYGRKRCTLPVAVGSSRVGRRLFSTAAQNQAQSEEPADHPSKRQKMTFPPSRTLMPRGVVKTMKNGFRVHDWVNVTTMHHCLPIGYQPLDRCHRASTAIQIQTKVGEPDARRCWKNNLMVGPANKHIMRP